MEELRGTFNTVYRESSGRYPGSFFLSAENELSVLCEGMAPKLRRGTPLRVTGQYSAADKHSFLVKDISMDTANTEALQAFFTGRHFEGLHKKTGAAMLDALRDAENSHDCSWAELPDEAIRQTLQPLQFPPDLTEALLKSITGIQRRKDIAEAFRGTRLLKKDVETLFEMYGGDAVTRSREAPYASLASGVSFAFCDDLAFENGIDRLDPERLNAFLFRMAEVIKQSGSCCMRLDEALSMLDMMQKRSRFKTLPKAMFLSVMLRSPEFVLKENSRYGIVVYPKTLYSAELSIVEELKRLNKCAEPTGYEEPEDTGTLDGDQIRALSFLKTEGVKILTGGPGAGKTTTIRKFVDDYRKIRPQDTIHLSAPTGRAAVRIAESTGKDITATTVHKMLDMRPYGDEMSCGFHKNHQLPKGLYIVDEMSMTDELLFLKLLQALPDHTTLILSGDPGQLPSVQAGTVLKDLVMSMALEHVELTGNHRQQGDTAIVDNYNLIKKRDPELIEDANFHIIRVADGESAARTTISLYDQYCKDNLQNSQILCAVKNGDAGKNTINGNICLERFHDVRPADLFGNTGYAVGDKIMMTRNNYKRGYWNGDTGVITKVASDYMEGMFYDGIRTIEEDDLVDMEHAFATTIHKSQGSEYDTVIIVLDKQFDNMLSNALILTAVTRAKKRVFIITVDNALEKAVVTDREAKRVTGLQDMIRENWEK